MVEIVRLEHGWTEDGEMRVGAWIYDAASPAVTFSDETRIANNDIDYLLP